jgi:RND family efflux transporter MFP subunit
MPLQTLFRIAIAITVIAVTTGCNQAPPPAVAPPPPTVTVAPPDEQDFTETTELSAHVEAVEAVEIRPRVSGYLTEVLFQAGQRVAKGDILFKIDSRPFDAALQRAEADLAQAQVRADWAARDDERATALVAQKTISPEEADQRRFQAAQARAALAGAEAALATAQLNREYSIVRSPIRGRISRAMVTPGNNISGVDGFTTLLATVVSDDPVHVYADLDEATLLRLQAMRAAKRLPTDAAGRIPVTVRIPDAPQLDRTGFVESFDNRIDSGTGSLLIRAEAANADGLLTPGQFARLELPVDAPARVLLVPEAAIGTDQAQRFVYLLSSSNTVDYRAVKLGPALNGRRIIREGLKSGDPVLVNGIARVFPGMPVQPIPATNAAVAASEAR